MKLANWQHALAFKGIWALTLYLASIQQEVWSASAMWSWVLLMIPLTGLYQYRSLLGGALLVGLLGDGLLCWNHVFYTVNGELLTVPPIWLMGLWVGFATLLPNIFAKIPVLQKWWVAMLIGSVSGVLSYRTGATIGALNIPNFSDDYWMIAIEWGIAFPLLLHLARQKKSAEIN